MAIDNVKEDATDQTATRTAENLVITGSAVRVFTVLFDDNSDPILVPQQAVDAPNIPIIYDPHPFSSFLFVKSKHARAVGGNVLLQEVTVNYEFRENPLAKVPEISFSHIASNEPIEEDVEGELIANSADEKFDPYITVDVYDLIVRITRNEATYDLNRAAELIGSINNDIFLGYDPGKVRINVLDGVETRVGQLFYFVVDYEFQIRFQSRGGVDTNWKRRVLDEGYRELTGENDDGTPKYEEITDDKGDKVTAAVKLDGLGRILAKAADPEFLEFDVHESFPFADLDIILRA